MLCQLKPKSPQAGFSMTRSITNLKTNIPRKTHAAYLAQGYHEARLKTNQLIEVNEMMWVRQFA
jgi:hypothetical protein